MKKLLISLLVFYKKVISPYINSNCKFFPTCSEYTIISIEKYGAVKGIAKGFYRILRCNIFSKGGIDFP